MDARYLLGELLLVYTSAATSLSGARNRLVRKLQSTGASPARFSRHLSDTDLGWAKQVTPGSNG